MRSDDECSSDHAGRSRRLAAADRVAFRLSCTLGIVLGCLAVAGFGWIAAAVSRGELLPLDAAGVRWARSTHSPVLTTISHAVDPLGGIPTLLVVLLLTTIFLPGWSGGGRDRRAGSSPKGGPGDRPGGGPSTGGDAVLLLWLAAFGGAILNLLLKRYFARPRPEGAATLLAGYDAFPSGHAMSAIVVYGTLAYLIVRGAPGRPLLQGLTIMGAAISISLIGVSRVYLGVHYATDVLGGYLIGFAWADLCILVFEWGGVRRRWGGMHTLER